VSGWQMLAVMHGHWKRCQHVKICIAKNPSSHGQVVSHKNCGFQLWLTLTAYHTDWQWCGDCNKSWKLLLER